MRTVEHWWNGVSGGHDRRDVFLRTDGSTWEIEVRHYPESSRRMRGLDEAEARAQVEQAVSPGDHPWQRLDQPATDQPEG